MSDPGTHTIPGQRTAYLPFSEGEIDEILDDLPLGHSVSEATRNLYLRLREARRNPPQPGPEPHHASSDLMHAPMQPVRPAPEEEPRAGLGICTRDVTGAFGLGVVCDVFIASDGATAIRWLGGPPQSQPRWEFYDNPGTQPFEQLGKYSGDFDIIWLDHQENE